MALARYGAGSKPGGIEVEHGEVEVCGGVGGASPFSVAPLVSQVRSVKYASELSWTPAPPTCWISRSRTLSAPPYANCTLPGPTALMSKGGIEYGPNGASRSFRFCTFSYDMTSKLPAANWNCVALAAWHGPAPFEQLWTRIGEMLRS